jgi:NDP-sugar pyrophosphorylase family protein
MSPDILDEIPRNEYFDMSDLIKKTIAKGKRVGVFPLREEYIEIGQSESYAVAEEFYKKNFR